MKHEVSVRATWETDTVFEFDTEHQAEEFAEKVNQGNLDVVIEAGDIYSDNASLMDYHAY